MWSTLTALKRNWAQYFISQSSGFLILLMTYAAALIVVTALTNLERLVDRWTEVGQVSVHLRAEVGPAERQSLADYLTDHPFVSGLEAVSADQAVASLVKRFAQVGAQFQVADLKPFANESLQVQLSQKAAKGELDSWTTELKERFPAIADIKYGKQWLARYLSLLQAANLIGWGLLILFLVSAMIVSNSVIKTVVFDRREEIEVLDFIGADDRQIYLPQVLSTFLMTLMAFLGALALTSLGLSILNEHLLSDLLQAPLSLAPFPSLALLFAVCLSASFVSAYWTVRRLLPRLTEAGPQDEAY